MELQQDTAGEVIVLNVTGRVDSNTVPALHDRLTALLAQARAKVLVDLSNLDYISSAGFRILLLAAKRADKTGCRFVLCGISGRVRQLFDMGGFLDLFSIAGTREEGIAPAGRDA